MTKLATPHSSLLTPHSGRVAFYSPLNPVRSGVSDYSEELLPYLADAGLDVTLFVDNYRPSNGDLLASFAVHPARDFARLHRQRPFAAAVYQMGNSPAHAYIHKALFANRGIVRGVVALHEFVLHHLVMWMALNGGQRKDYQREMEARYGERGAEAARRVLLGQTPESLFNFPLSERVITAADQLIVHNHYMAARIAEVAPDKPVTVVPMGVPLPPRLDRAAARARLGIEADEFIVASLGHINPYKRLTPSLRAYKAFAMERPRSRYFLVGSISANYNVGRQVEALGLEERVVVTGHVDIATFNDYLAAADVCLNLRYPSAGETSAALLRIMGAGQAVIVSNTAAFAELPPAAAVHIDVEGDEEALLLEYLLALADRPALRAALGRNARRYIARYHTLEGAAAGYDAALHQQPWNADAYARSLLLTADSEPAPVEPVTFTDAPTPAKSIQSAETTHSNLKPQTSNLITALAEAAADVGVAPGDDALLREFARVAAELGAEGLSGIARQV
jgi:glycosyltransferase involved in cell wall biosynthesis